MNEQEAALFLAALGALEAADEDESASKGFIEDAEPMTATCTVEYSDE